MVWVYDHSHGNAPQLERVDATILTRPFCESNVSMHPTTRPGRRLTECVDGSWAEDEGYQ